MPDRTRLWLFDLVALHDARQSAQRHVQVVDDLRGRANATVALAQLHPDLAEMCAQLEVRPVRGGDPEQGVLGEHFIPRQAVDDLLDTTADLVRLVD